MSSRGTWWRLPWLLLFALAVASPAHALPGFYVGKSAGERTAHETHVVLMRKDERSVITVMPDYEGPFDAFALVLPVPADVTLAGVKTLKREFVDRVDQISAPRFHEWWEVDPCEPGEPEQEWQRSLKADPNSAFLGGGGPTPSGGPVVPRELFTNVKPDYKDGEYTFSLVTAGQPLAPALKAKGYTLSAAAVSAVEPYARAGMSFVVAEVDPKRIELVGSNRAQLSPIRYESEKPFETLPVRLGLLSARGMQELIVYVLHPQQRFEAKNYPNAFAPTNVELDIAVKERTGEFYAALHDLMLRKNPEAILSEYAWHSAGCGEPCPNAALQASELMSLGGDFFEAALPEEVRKAPLPPLTEDEKRAERAALGVLPPNLQPKRKRELDRERRIAFDNRGILERQKYIVSRFHHRYDRNNLPNDIQIGAAAAVRGGIGVPKGEGHEISSEVTAASENRFQIRFNAFHPWAGMQKCEKQARFRWGRAPRTYRGLRKTWIAQDLARKNRTQIRPSEVVITPVGALGLPGRAAAAAVDAAAQAAAD
ncbi:MAG TPA: DUF2330 domain-containing protein, partial [Polyangiaceae bacterium]|nr:DUF2330 domain-containing protein [Polyangiaceae bacterium]